jgi:mRNA interferase MazF
VKKYVPARGDILWLDFDPRTGHEQAGHGPALVLSEERFNKQTGLCVVCPLTTKGKGSAFEVPGPPLATGAACFVLSQHVRTVDWVERKAKFKAKASPHMLRDVLQRVMLILGVEDPSIRRT